MKLQLVGVTRRFGTGKDSGQQYDMAVLLALTKLNNTKSDLNTYQTAGFREMEVELKPDSFAEFSTLKFPCEIDVTTEPRATSNGLVTVVNGIVK